MTGLLVMLLAGMGLLFAAAVFFGPPYLPTLRRQQEAALDLLDLKPGQLMLELGSGDGRVALAAARRGWRVVGIEINPLLVLIARLRTRHYRGQVRIIWGSYFKTTWPPADGIFTFMLQRQMWRLGEAIEQWREGRTVRLASVAFFIPDLLPAKVRAGVYLYIYKT